MFVNCKNCCVYYFTLQPGTDALICARVHRKVFVDHYFMKGYDTPTKTTPVSTGAYTLSVLRLGKHFPKVIWLYQLG